MKKIILLLVVATFLSCETKTVEVNTQVGKSFYGDQNELFAGNMIELINEKGSFLFMSESAYKTLDKNQINKISKYSNIIYSPVSTIESFGGGSVRCMIAEIFN